MSRSPRLAGVCSLILAGLLGGLHGAQAFAACPLQARILTAPPDRALILLEADRDSLSELESAHCSLLVAERLDQTRASDAIRISTEAMEVMGRLGTRRDRSDASFVNARLRMTQGRDPSIGKQLKESLDLCDDDRDCQTERLLVIARFEGESNQLESARKRMEAAQAIILELHGQEHLLMAEAMRTLSQVAYRQGRYDEELDLLTRALSLQERLLEANDPDIAGTALLLGFSLADRGRYDEALLLYQRSLDIRLKVLGTDNTDTAQSMLALGSVSTIRGDYLKAKPLIEQAVAVRERLLPPGHTNLTAGYVQLAHLLERMGDKDGAERAYRKVLAIAEKNDDFEKQFLAWQGLAGVAVDRHDPRAAKLLLEKSLALMVEQNYTSHSWQDGRYMMAEIQRSLGNSSASLALHEAVLGERIEVRPEGDALIAKSRFAVAMLQVELGNASQLDAAQAALVDIAADYGLLHPDLEELLTRLAQAQHAHSHIEEAAATALRAVDVRLHVLSETTFGLSEAEALRYADDDVPALDLAFMLAGRYPDRVALGPVWNRLLAMRDLVLRRVAGRVALSKASADPLTMEAARKLQASSERYVRLLLLNSESGNHDTWRKQLASARDEREGAERALAESLIALQVEDAPTLDSLRILLTDEQRLVSFVVGKEGHTDHYFALVVGKKQQPLRIDLGSAAAIDVLLRRWRLALSSSEAGTELSRRVLQPVLEASRSATELFLIPAGALHLLPWAALPVDDGKFLVERGPIIRLLHREAELANATTPDGQRAATGEGLLALGGAQFGSRTSTPTSGSCASFIEHDFVGLPGSITEIQELQREWPGWRPNEPVTAHIGEDASERRFREQAPGKRVLHLATHAFFVDPQTCLTDNRLVRGVGSLVAREQVDTVALAGLALANANRRAQLPSADDGILAAEEIAMLDLRGVELAVLSACDTALGTLTSTEGVLGLRRAFRLAGVDSLITSLWKVGDEDARIWMRAFYSRLAANEQPSGQAAWSATAEVLAARRTAKADLDPIHWAGFVATGN